MNHDLLITRMTFFVGEVLAVEWFQALIKMYSSKQASSNTEPRNPRNLSYLKPL